MSATAVMEVGGPAALAGVPSIRQATNTRSNDSAGRKLKRTRRRAMVGFLLGPEGTRRAYTPYTPRVVRILGPGTPQVNALCQILPGGRTWKETPIGRTKATKPIPALVAL